MCGCSKSTNGETRAIRWAKLLDRYSRTSTSIMSRSPSSHGTAGASRKRTPIQPKPSARTKPSKGRKTAQTAATLAKKSVDNVQRRQRERRRERRWERHAVWADTKVGARPAEDNIEIPAAGSSIIHIGDGASLRVEQLHLGLQSLHHQLHHRERALDPSATIVDGE